MEFPKTIHAVIRREREFGGVQSELVTGATPEHLLSRNGNVEEIATYELVCIKRYRKTEKIEAKVEEVL
jgi:hypothetical protein